MTGPVWLLWCGCGGGCRCSRLHAATNVHPCGAVLFCWRQWRIAVSARQFAVSV